LLGYQKSSLKQKNGNYPCFSTIICLVLSCGIYTNLWKESHIIRTIKFPVSSQFLVVLLLSLVLAVYLAAASASTRLESRVNDGETQETLNWEKVALWTCPLH